MVYTCISLVLRFTFHLFLCSAFTLHHILLCILHAQFLDIVSITILRTIGTSGMASIIPINYQQLLSDPGVKAVTCQLANSKS